MQLSRRVCRCIVECGGPCRAACSVHGLPGSCHPSPARVLPPLTCPFTTLPPEGPATPHLPTARRLPSPPLPAQLGITAAGGVKGLVKALLDPGCHPSPPHHPSPPLPSLACPAGHYRRGGGQGSGLGPAGSWLPPLPSPPLPCLPSWKLPPQGGSRVWSRPCWILAVTRKSRGRLRWRCRRACRMGGRLCRCAVVPAYACRMEGWHCRCMHA